MKSLLGRLGVLFIGLLILGYSDVWGANWKLFNHDEKSFDYYDAEGIIRPSKNIVRVWVKRVYTKEGVIDAVQKLGKRFATVSHDIDLLEINCADKKQHFLYMSSYSEKGEIIHSENQTTEWNFIVPESVGEAFFKKICE